MPGRPHHHARWAEEVDEEEAHHHTEDDEQRSPLYDELSGQYRSRDAGWVEGMDVGRGRSKQRLDLSHGFMQSIVSVLRRSCWQGSA